MMNGREITITWRGELKDDSLSFRRQLGGGPEMSPLSLQRAKSWSRPPVSPPEAVSKMSSGSRWTPI